MTPQQIFNSHYVTACELEKELGVTRSAIITATKKGVLPEPIRVGGTRAFIWPRDLVRTYVNNWKTNLEQRRGINGSSTLS